MISLRNRLLKFYRLPASFWSYFLILLAIITPWLLKPGYLFFTDMVWGPNIWLDWASPSLLFNLMVKGLLFIFSPDLLEKIYIVGILILILLAGRFLIKSVLKLSSVESGAVSPGGLVFVLSLFSLFNPFVYDRALYGQFGTLISYGFFIFSLSYLAECWQSLEWRYLFQVSLFSALTIMFSMHFIFLLAPFYVLFLLGLYLKRREIKAAGSWRKLIQAASLGLLLIFFINANWLIALSIKVSPLAKFVEQGITAQDLTAFQTAGRTPAETFSNVLLMSGFWGKEQFRYFDLTDAPGWQRSFIFLTPLIIYGVYLSFRRRPRAEKILHVGLILIFVLVVALAVGVGSPFTRGLTLFLYDHLPLYKGLREPQKWVAAIIPIYLFYLTVGANRLRSFKLVAAHRLLSGILLAGVIIMGAPSLIWGFNGQAVPTPYPADWYEAENYFQDHSTSSSGCNRKLLFLPWHLYLSFTWSGKIMANPAPIFFFCPVISGTNMEFGGIYDNSLDPAGKKVESWLAGAGKDEAAVRGLGVNYVVLAKEVDWRNYDWLNDLGYVKMVKETMTLKIYEVK